MILRYLVVRSFFHLGDLLLRLLTAQEAVIQTMSIETVSASGDIFLTYCTGFGWNGVTFLSSSLYGAVLWVSDQNNVVSTPVF